MELVIKCPNCDTVFVSVILPKEDDGKVSYERCPHCDALSRDSDQWTFKTRELTKREKEIYDYER